MFWHALNKYFFEDLFLILFVVIYSILHKKMF